MRGFSKYDIVLSPDGGSDSLLLSHPPFDISFDKAHLFESILPFADPDACQNPEYALCCELGWVDQ